MKRDSSRGSTGRRSTGSRAGTKGLASSGPGARSGSKRSGVGDGVFDEVAGSTGPPWPPLVDLYLERLRRQDSTSAGSAASASARQQATTSSSSWASWASRAPGAGPNPATPPEDGRRRHAERRPRSRRSTAGAAGPATKTLQLRQMIAACGDAVRQIDELGAMTEQLIEELGSRNGVATAGGAWAAAPCSSRGIVAGGPLACGSSDDDSCSSAGGACGGSGCASSSSNTSGAGGGCCDGSNSGNYTFWSQDCRPEPAVLPINLWPEGQKRDRKSASQRLSAKLGAGVRIQRDSANARDLVTDAAGAAAGASTACEPQWREEPPDSWTPGPAAEPAALPMDAPRSGAANVHAAPGAEGSSAQRSLALAERWLASRAVPAASAAVVSYPCCASVHIATLAAHMDPAAGVDGAQRVRLVQAIESGGLLRLALQTLRAFSELRGSLTWSQGLVRDFVAAVFAQSGLKQPEEGQVCSLCMRFDPGGRAAMEATSCLALVDALARAALASGVQAKETPAAARGAGDGLAAQPVVPHEVSLVGDIPRPGTFQGAWIAPGLLGHGARVSGAEPAPVGPQHELPKQAEGLEASQCSNAQDVSLLRATSELTAIRPEDPTACPQQPEPWTMGARSLVLDAEEAADSCFTGLLRPAAVANAPHRERATHALENGEVAATVLELFRTCGEVHGSLAWHGGGIWRLVEATFHRFGAVPPAEDAVAAVFVKVDRMRRGTVDAGQCVRLLEALFRAVFSRSHMPGSTSSADEEWVARHVPVPVAGTTRVTYLNKFSVDLSKLAPALAAAAVANAAHRNRTLNSVESGSLLRDTLRRHRERCGPRADAPLAWPGGVQAFLSMALEEHGLSPPRWEALEGLWAAFGAGHGHELAVREALCLLEALVRGLLGPLLAEGAAPGHADPLAGDLASAGACTGHEGHAEVGGSARASATVGEAHTSKGAARTAAADDANAVASDACARAPAAEQGRHSAEGAASITYLGRVHVSFAAFAAALRPLAAANAPHRDRVLRALDTGTLTHAMLRAFQACDRERAGALAWGSGGVREFVAEVFRQQGLALPTEGQVYQMYARFDADRKGRLDARECLCLADALLRSVFSVPLHGMPVARASAGGPEAP